MLWEPRLTTSSGPSTPLLSLLWGTRVALVPGWGPSDETHLRYSVRSFAEFNRSAPSYEYWLIPLTALQLPCLEGMRGSLVGHLASYQGPVLRSLRHRLTAKANRVHTLPSVIWSGLVGCAGLRTRSVSGRWARLTFTLCFLPVTVC